MFINARSAMRRFDSTVLLPTCGVSTTFDSDAQIAGAGGGHVGLARKHVERRSGDAPGRQRFEQRRLVHHGAARGVDEPRSIVHLREPLPVDEPGVLAIDPNAHRLQV